MTQDEIIEMARQAGKFKDGVFPEPWIPFFVDFAKLVAAKEREACAKVAENRALVDATDIEKIAHHTACKNIAADIRARGWQHDTR